MTATDDWITFADSHMLPNESIDACEGWPKGMPLTLFASLQSIHSSIVAPGSMGPAKIAKLKAMGIEKLVLNCYYLFVHFHVFFTYAPCCPNLPLSQHFAAAGICAVKLLVVTSINFFFTLIQVINIR
jgi:hypothetical protein